MMTFETIWYPHLYSVVQLLIMLAMGRLFRRGFFADGRKKVTFYLPSFICLVIATAMMPRLDWTGVAIVVVSITALITFINMMVDWLFARHTVNS
ncbi:MAG: hypothetical protein KW788_04880 [Candidatus Doudnabacteria bacterium]|nr:hypothetical protein [Candidatus Doudnabacteria bacterium]